MNKAEIEQINGRVRANPDGVQIDEFSATAEFLLDHAVTGFIEIGVWGVDFWPAHCASFRLWASIIDGIKIGIDTRELPIELKEEFSNVHLVRGASREPGTVISLREILQDTQVGWLFIDGDHDGDNPMTDYRLYEPFVRPGGYIGFHDTIVFGGNIGTFFNELPGDKVRFGNMGILRKE